MQITKIKTALLLIIITTLLVFLCPGATVHAKADEVQGTEQTETIDPDISSNEEGLTVQFIQYLKDKYGNDYEFYYNQIIERWGSVEAYLLAVSDKLPAPAQNGWEKFVGWLGEYAVIWATPLAIAIIIVVLIAGKKQFNKIVERVVNSIVNKKLAPINNELNLQSKATAVMLKAQRSMLPLNEKFEETRAELKDAEEALNG